MLPLSKAEISAAVMGMISEIVAEIVAEMEHDSVSSPIKAIATGNPKGFRAALPAPKDEGKKGGKK